jgi:glutamate synthase (NADPH) small chain
MLAEGVMFETKVNVGTDVSVGYLMRAFDAIVIAAGSRTPRDLAVPGRELNGVHYALDFLIQQNREIAGDKIPVKEKISAKGKHVLVIGGGDTGSDCVGTSRRHGATTITQIEILPKPPESRAINNPWPQWPIIMRTSSSHEEGCERIWSVLVKEVKGNNGQVSSVMFVRIEWYDDNGKQTFRELPGSEFELEANLVLIAMGFIHVDHGPLVTEFGIRTDNRGNLVVDENNMTSVPGVFACGDSVLGASLVVKAIAQGRKTAEGVNTYVCEEKECEKV